MKKTIVVTALSIGLLVLGAGNTLAMEEETQNGNAYGTFNFGQKLSKHENMTVHEVKEMYVNHHGTVGAAPSQNFNEHKQCMMMEE
ncbi:hypothetical protein BKP45_13970 [Anaerobacillus alkalidiazotrophicus]|uniref:DUF2680 domain-containing protein n=1 Tax=Anaerobacillus alkalidiazotrophicus TaxID=472963 RepID=A0A1S2M425_9BACI|nr:hypothetical protein [Anaerobacillus alkalidiazotrophicus]OIJ19260.1 hypothetical protein BKP45_13970 [Anaerobacillus alkalidiazotrophicus]